MSKHCPLAHETATRRLKRRVRELRQSLPRARIHDVEGIHDLRVASRRLRATVAEHTGLFPVFARQAFQVRARRLTQALGAAREIDVTIRLLKHIKKRLHGVVRLAANHVIRRLRRGRMEVSASVDDAVRLADCDEFDAMTMTLLDGMRPAKECHVDHAVRRFAKLCRALAEVYALWSSTHAEETLHLLRVQLKKFRYSCEEYSDLYIPREMKKLLERLRGMQEAIGDWNDHRVLRRRAREAMGGASSRASQGFPALFALLDQEVAARLERVSVEAVAFFCKTHMDEMRTLFHNPRVTCCESSAVEERGAEARPALGR